MGVNAMIVGVSLACFLGAAVALQCYQCGMYNDGVGSITPCLNESHMKLIECPRRDHQYCIKYISEGSTVKDCVPKCSERATTEFTFNNINVHVYDGQSEVANHPITCNNLLEGLHLSGIEFDAVQIGEYVSAKQLDMEKIFGITPATLPVLKKESLTGLNLSSLEISYTNLEHVEPQAFKNVIKLKKLAIEQNSLREIKKGVFNGLPVMVLLLNSNEIRAVEPGSFEAMPELLILRLAYNKLANLAKHFLSDLPKLQLVDLSWNGIEKIENGAFENLPELKVLLLERNWIKEVGDQFVGHLPNLRELVLSFNKLREFQSDFVIGDEKLEKIYYIDNNEITEVAPSFLVGMHELKVLDMSFNNINVIKNGTFSNLNIIELDLSNNDIRHIEKGALTNLPKLNILNLAHNNVNELDAFILSELSDNVTINFKTYRDMNS